ncbi:aromatic ring-hydroxylating dioxygenase subunit alpha [Scytonema tolypothrichoides VB-61278]|nr:aromatic ring-hydroxylating dioxygenase subunit alpha [Scytonema tolypothrichoides VB-61278]
MVTDVVLQNDWHVVATSQDLQPGKILKVRLLGQDLVLWRNGDQAVAWEDRCPHRGASLAQGWIENDALVCPYHGLAFNGGGKCVHVPAHPDQPPPERSKACVQTYHIKERYGFVWVSLGTPEKDVPPLPEWDNPNYHKFVFGPTFYRASPLRALENFIDVNHVPFVHGGTIGNPEYARINDDFKVEVKPDGIHINNVHVWENDPKIQGKVNSYNLDFRVLRPLTASLRRRAVDEPLIIFYTITPVDEEECLVWRWTFLNHNVPEKQFHNFTGMVMSQDAEAIESQRPKRLPLDLQAEYHLPSDRTTVIYRKWLKNQGVTFGTV